MADVSVTMKKSGLNALMRSAEVQAKVDAEGQALALRAGPDFEYVRGSSHPWVARGFVQAKDARGMRAEARDKVLTRAVGSGS